MMKYLHEEWLKVLACSKDDSGEAAALKPLLVDPFAPSLLISGRRSSSCWS